MTAITQHTVDTGRHRTTYLQAGDDGAPLVVLVHGWPERAISWRHQLAALSDAGYLAVAPDMRGYGGSTVHSRHHDYALEPVVADMLELLDSLGRATAVWVGHDWGSPVVWSIAGHHPQRCHAVASLCVPYDPAGFTLDSLIPLVDRDLYPADQFPAGQWEYFLHYREQFDQAAAAFQADVSSTVRALFRRGDPRAVGRRSPLAYTRINGGWFAPGDAAPDVPMDDAVLDEASLATYVDGLQRNGFFGPDSWYMNDGPNAEYARRSLHGGRLAMPVLFLHARFDQVCETVTSRLATPMRERCEQLDEVVVDSGHWMAQEQPAVVNDALLAWLGGLPAWR